MLVEICVHPERLYVKQSSKENKTSSYKWFTEEHFTVSTLRLYSHLVPKHSA